MHNNNTVVSLYALNGSRKTPLREYDHKRGVLESSVRVPLKFGSEYGIGFKFQNTGRRRLELWIDGAMVTDNLILDGESFLERFMDSDKRFRFVEASNAAVADPTSPSNGGVMVKLWREQPDLQMFKLAPDYGKQWPQPPVAPWQPWTPPVVWGRSGCPGDPSRSLDVMCGGSQSSAGSEVRGVGYGDPIINGFSCSCSNSSPSTDTSNLSLFGKLKGATIEGSASKQVFNSTVWLGDFGSPLIFKFQLHGIEEVKQGNFCPGCGIKRKNPTNFCPNCGAKQ
jgi:hypothetical protein